MKPLLQRKLNSSRGLMTLVGFLAVLLVLFVIFRGQDTTAYATTVKTTEPSRFSYDVTKGVIDSEGLRLVRNNSALDVVYLDSIPLAKNAELVGFAQRATLGAGSSIGYQFTTDFTQWYWYDGRGWVAASSKCSSCWNSVEEVNAHIASLPLQSESLKMRLSLKSGAKSVPTLESVAILSTGQKKDAMNGQSQVLASRFEALADNSFRAASQPEQDQVTICHRTNADTNPYVIITVDADAVDGEGNNDHTQHIVDAQHAWGDIIPIGDQNNDGEITEADCTYTAPGNLPPTAVDDVAATAVNTPVVITVLTNDTDPEGQLDPTTVTITVPATHGIVTINPTTGEITYAPAADYSGPDTFTYQVCDVGGLCATAVVTIDVLGAEAQVSICHATGSENNPFVVLTVDASSVDGEGNNDHAQHEGDIIPITDRDGDQDIDEADCVYVEPPADHPPVAVDDSAFTFVNQPVTIDVPVNDIDSGSDLNLGSVTITVAPTNGAVVVNPTTGEITYTPNTDFIGTDTFEYQICDGLGLCDTALVTVYVMGGDDQVTICHATGSENNPYVILSVDPSSVDGEGNNDHANHEGDIIPITDRNGDQEIDQADCVYTPPTENQPPVAVDDSAITSVNVPVIVDVPTNDYDSDGNLDLTTVTIISGPTHGSITNVNPITGAITYSPDTNFVGTDSFTYQICDTNNLCDTAVVTITILGGEEQVTICHATGSENNPYVVLEVDASAVDGQGENDHANHEGDIVPITDVNDDGEITKEDCSYSPANNPPVAVNDTAQTPMGVPVVIDVLLNDSDPDSNIDPASVIIITPPIHGMVSVDSETGAITYTPDEGYYGTDTFVYQVCDTTLLCDQATVTVTVLSPPTALDDGASTAVNTPVVIDVLDNDTDPDGALVPATVEVTTQPLHGTVSINQTTGAITYTPNTGYTGSDSFVYKVCDDDGLCDSATVTITIGQISPPIANDDTVATDRDVAVNISVLSNDTGVDGTLVPNTVTIITQPSFGTITNINLTNGVITYTPNPGYVGNDTFVYEVCDTNFLCDTATVTIQIRVRYTGGGGGGGGGNPPPPPEPPTEQPPIPQPPEPPLIEPLIVPLEFLPAPEPLPEPTPTAIGWTFGCGTVYQTLPITIGGFVTGQAGNVAGLEYSLNGGLSWVTVPTVFGLGTGTGGFNLTFTNIPTGGYSAIVRALDVDGTTTVSGACPFTLDTGLVIGANEITTFDAQASPLDDTGTVYLQEGEGGKIYIEGTPGATEAMIIGSSVRVEFPLTYDENLHLWVGTISFEETGAHKLTASFSNGIRDYERPINNVLVTNNGLISDKDGNAISDVTVTVYERGVDGKFSVWAGAAYGQANPFMVSGAFSFVLPSGEFYIQVTHPDYRTLTSLITQVPSRSVVTSNIVMEPEGGFWYSLFSRIGLVDSPDNFPLTVTSVNNPDAIPAGTEMPNVELITVNKDKTSLYDETKGKKALVMVYSGWNTLAAEQMASYTELIAKYPDIVLLPVSTLEPVNISQALISRGAYALPVYKVGDAFYEAYHVMSLPQFFFLDVDHKLQGMMVGSQTSAQLEAQIQKFLGQ